MYYHCILPKVLSFHTRTKINEGRERQVEARILLNMNLVFPSSGLISTKTTVSSWSDGRI